MKSNKKLWEKLLVLSLAIAAAAPLSAMREGDGDGQSPRKRARAADAAAGLPRHSSERATAGTGQAEGIQLRSGAIVPVVKRCRICRREGAPRTMQTRVCVHRFHRRCLLRWLRYDFACPICCAAINLDTLGLRAAERALINLARMLAAAQTAQVAADAAVAQGLEQGDGAGGAYAAVPVQYQLYEAARVGDVAWAQALLAAGASVDAADQDGLTPLQVAEKMHHDEIAALLRAAGGAGAAV